MKDHGIYFYISLLVISIIAAGCGTATKAYRVVDPRDINKQILSKSKAYYSPEFKIPYAKSEGVNHPEEFWGGVIDEKWESYSKCVKTKLKKNPDLKKIRKVKVVILKDNNSVDLEKIAPYTKSQGVINNKATAYVCENFVCKLPTNDPDKMLELIKN